MNRSASLRYASHMLRRTTSFYVSSGDTVAGRRPTLRDQQLGTNLRQARGEIGLTQEQAAAALNLSQPTIARIEAGKRPPAPEELQAFLDLYNPPQPLRDAINACATLTDTPGLSPNPYFIEMVGAVENADEIRTFHSERTPMHLQSQQYALLQHRLADNCFGETDVLRSREQRLRIFTRENPPYYRALLTESSLHRTPGGSLVVVKQQAQYLLRLLEQYPRFSLQIVHTYAKLAYIDTDFTLLRMPSGQPDMVYVPYGLDGRLIKDRRGVDERESYWSAAQHAALSEEESRKLIHELAEHG
jgi:transcriptional regulator with XRE-family HTH domain